MPTQIYFARAGKISIFCPNMSSRYLTNFECLKRSLKFCSFLVGFSFFLICFEKNHILQSQNSMRHHCSRLGGRKGPATKPQDSSFKVELSSYSKRCPLGSQLQLYVMLCPWERLCPPQLISVEKKNSNAISA